MAAIDFKISSADISAVHVEAQPTVLRGSAQDNKKVFDKYSDMIVSHFNGLCDYIETSVGTEVDIEVLQLFVADGWIPDN